MLLKKKFVYLILLMFPSVHAQENKYLQEKYGQFRQQAQQEYNEFRFRANRVYADFMRQAWEWYQALPEIPRPKDEPPVPPVTYPEEEKDKPMEDVLHPIEEIVTVMEQEAQPKPVEPIQEELQSTEQTFAFSFFGTEGRVRLDDSHRFALRTCSGDGLAEAWERLAGNSYNNVIRDCLELRIRHQLCDWAYLLMLQELSDAFLGKGSNESTLFCAYLYCQSGYQMRMGLGNGRLYLLVASKHQIYNRAYWQIEGNYYYPLDCKERSLEICAVSFPGEKPLSLLVSEEPLLAERLSENRKLQSERYAEVKAETSINKNLLAFFDTYPSSMLSNNVCTRWAFYANTPLSGQVKRQLYPSLKAAIAGKSQLEAANRLLNFVQTAFVYEYDDKVWGGDRAFFAEETLYYPYCDCEDRSILFSRLVRDLLGLKVLLVYYPGHLATAVCFTEKVAGDYMMLEGRKYVICDPTYIGAPVGKTMPEMDNAGTRVILLE